MTAEHPAGIVDAALDVNYAIGLLLCCAVLCDLGEEQWQCAALWELRNCVLFILNGFSPSFDLEEIEFRGRSRVWWRVTCDV